jgi:hypothetical protein
MTLAESLDLADATNREMWETIYSAPFDGSIVTHKTLYLIALEHQAAINLLIAKSIHALWNQRRLESFPRAVPRRLLTHVVRNCAQCQFAQGGQITLPKGVRERLFDFLGPIDVPLAEPVAQLLDGDVDVDDLVGAVKERVGHGLPHAYTCGTRHGVVECH